MQKFTDGKFKEDKLVEIWGDIVAMKELLISIVISVTAGLLGYLIAPGGNSVVPLLVALICLVIATIVNSIIFKPKRSVTFEDKEEDN